MGATVIAITERKSGIYDEHGIDVDAAGLYYRERGELTDFPHGDAITNEELLTCDCDVLIPAAMESTVTADIAPHIKARILVEAANGPTTPEADEILRDNGVTVLPDILANAGGVTVSYFEWVQGLQNFFWSLKEVQDELQKVMERAFDAGQRQGRPGRLRLPHRRLHDRHQPRRRSLQAQGAVSVRLMSCRVAWLAAMDDFLSPEFDGAAFVVICD